MVISSRSQILFEIRVFYNFAISTGNTCVESLFNKVAELKTCNFIKNKTPTQVFSCEYGEIFKKAYQKSGTQDPRKGPATQDPKVRT